jgi:myosin heavy subunit
MMAIRRRVREARKASIVIQAASRRFLVKEQLKRKLVFVQGAVRIQTFWRMFRLRHNFLSVVRASVLVQAAMRRFLARKLADQQRVRDAAIVLLQARWRSSRRKREFQSIRQAAVSIQATYRGHASRYQRKLRSDAVTQIQSYWRMKICRSHYVATKKAVAIGAAARRFMAKKKFERALKAELCAVRIQTFWRMTQERRNFLAFRQATVLAQTVARGFLAKRRASDQRTIVARHEACVLVQAVVRGFLAKNRARELRIIVARHQASLLMQAVARGFIARKYASEQRRIVVLRNRLESDAATKIQSHWRMKAPHGHMVEVKNAVVTIQAASRGFMARRSYEQLLISVSSAIVVQSFWKMKVCRSNFISVRSASVLLQTSMRGFLARRSARRLLLARKLRVDAAIQVQRYWRVEYCRRSFAEARAAIVTIQTSSRGFVARRRALRMRATLQEKRDAEKIANEVQGATPARTTSRKPLGEVTTAPATRASRKPLGDVNATRSTRSSRKPLGEVTTTCSSTVASPVNTRRRTTRSTATSGDGEENGGNVNRRTDTASKQVGRKPASETSNEDTGTSSADLQEQLEQMKVVELRAELKQRGVESKVYNKLRKAQLVQLLVTERTAAW